MTDVVLFCSRELMTELFGYCFCGILYQRGVYPPASFSVVKKFDLDLVVTSSPYLQNYLRDILTKLDQWFVSREVLQATLILKGGGGEDLERWRLRFQIGPTELSRSEIQQRIEQTLLSIADACRDLPPLPVGAGFDIEIHHKEFDGVPVHIREYEPPREVTPVMSVPQGPIFQSGAWLTGLLDFDTDSEFCAQAIFCPCLAYAENMELMGEETYVTSCCLYSICSLTCVQPFFSAVSRQKIRNRYSISGSPASDLCVHCVCIPCALIQEHKQLISVPFRPRIAESVEMRSATPIVMRNQF